MTTATTDGFDVAPSGDGFGAAIAVLENMRGESNERASAILEEARAARERALEKRRKARNKRASSAGQSQDPRPSNTRVLTRKDKHWTSSDPVVFSGLSQGGGGIDYLTLSLRGFVSGQGWKRIEKLKALRDGLRLEGLPMCMVEIGEGDNREKAILYDHSTGRGRALQPVTLEWQGLTLRFGRAQSSDGKDGSALAYLEAKGEQFLRHGEAVVLERMKQFVDLVGLNVEGVRVTRLDVCADLPDAKVAEFVGHVIRDEKVDRLKTDATVNVGKGGCTGFTIHSEAVTLNVYEKVIQATKVKDSEYLALLAERRWGKPCEKAVRVEFRFRMSKLSGRKYESLEAVLLGLGELLHWAGHEWFRLCLVRDRTNCNRAPLADCWLRTMHAFAYVCGRLNQRPDRRLVYAAAPGRIAKILTSTLATLLVRSGVRPHDFKQGEEFVYDGTDAWRLGMVYITPTELMAAIRKKALELDIRKGNNMPGNGVNLDRYEDEWRELGEEVRRYKDVSLWFD